MAENLGREVVAPSTDWHPSIGPIYVDDGSMVPKALLSKLVEVRKRERLPGGRRRVMWRYYVVE